jgi:hypothetical protein
MLGGADWIRTFGSSLFDSFETSFATPWRVNLGGGSQEIANLKKSAAITRNKRNRQFESSPLRQPVRDLGIPRGTMRNGFGQPVPKTKDQVDEYLA